MSRHRSRGFTLTEVVVALLIAATAALAFTTALLAEQRLRSAADAEARGARAAREHLELLAARSCGRDTSGSSRGPWGEEWWRGTSVPGGYRFSDSVRARRARRALGVSALTGCAP